MIPTSRTMRAKTGALLGLIVTLLFAIPSAHADEASKRAKIEQLFVLTKVDSMMSQMMSQMSAAMIASTREQAAKQKLTPEQQVFADKFTARVDSILKKSLSLETLKPLFLKVYMDTYTEEELSGIVAFYESPAGKAYVAKTPELMQRSMQLMQQQVVEAQPQLEAAQKELMDEMAHNSTKP